LRNKEFNIQKIQHPQDILEEWHRQDFDHCVRDEDVVLLMHSMLKMMKEMRRKAMLKINGESQELAVTTEKIGQGQILQESFIWPIFYNSREFIKFRPTGFQACAYIWGRNCLLGFGAVWGDLGVF
jgi:hypothetical protein